MQREQVIVEVKSKYCSWSDNIRFGSEENISFRAISLKKYMLQMSGRDIKYNIIIPAVIFKSQKNYIILSLI